MHGNPAKEDRKGHSKSGPNGLNKKQRTGVGAIRRSWCFLTPHRLRGVKISFPFSQLYLRHPVLFYRTQKIGKFGNLSPPCQ